MSDTLTAPYANLVGLYPSAISLPAPGPGESYVVIKTGGNFSESGIHAGIAVAPSVLVGLARSSMSTAKLAAFNNVFTQIAADVGSKAPLSAYSALFGPLFALAEAQ